MVAISAVTVGGSTFPHGRALGGGAPAPAPPPPYRWTYKTDASKGAQGVWHVHDDACDGTRQSPVDIPVAIASTLAKPLFASPSAAAAAYPSQAADALQLQQRDYALQAKGALGSIELGGATYTATSLSLRCPSEHKVRGQGWACELQLLHQKAGSLGSDDLLAIGVGVEAGDENAFFTALAGAGGGTNFSGAPAAAAAERRLGGDGGSSRRRSSSSSSSSSSGSGNSAGSVSVGSVTHLGESLKEQLAAGYYHYSGSQTAPPCAQTVSWFIMKETAKASTAQIAALTALYSPNSRRTQPVDGNPSQIADGILDGNWTADSLALSGSADRSIMRCDHSAAPPHGTAGTCGKNVTLGATCQPACDVGYHASGPSTCAAGGAGKKTLVAKVAATCLPDPKACHDPESFLGVANADCIGQNGKTAAALIGLIVFLSISFELIVHKLNHSTTCPQMLAIIGQLFGEIMILGFISMSFFLMSVNGVTKKLADFDALLDETELFHFQEFFHYLVFVTMMFYIAEVLFLVYLSTKIPRMWQRTETRLKEKEQKAMLKSKSKRHEVTDLVASKYHEVKKLRRDNGWRVKVWPNHWWNWWLVVVRMGYSLAREQTRALYENREVMDMLFGLPVHDTRTVDYRTFSTYSTRALLVQMLKIHWSTWVVMVGLAALNVVRTEIGLGEELLDQYSDEGNVDSVVKLGACIFLWAVVLAAKSFSVLMGIINDRTKDLAKARSQQKDGGAMAVANPLAADAPGSDSGAAGAAPAPEDHGDGNEGDEDDDIARAVQALSTSDAHLKRFWFRRPRVLILQVQMIIFMLAIYMAMVILMYVDSGKRVWGGAGLFLMVLWPLLIVLFIVPLMLPTLSVTFNLIGWVGAEKLDKLNKANHHGHGDGSKLRKISFCPNCGSSELVREEGKLMCEACGTVGLPSKMKVLSLDAHDHEKHEKHGGDHGSRGNKLSRSLLGFKSTVSAKQRAKRTTKAAHDRSASTFKPDAIDEVAAEHPSASVDESIVVASTSTSADVHA